MNNEKILIIDNELQYAEYSASILKPLGYEIFFADNGVKGLLLVNKIKYDLIMINIFMHPISGFEICRKIKEKNNIPVIFFISEQKDLKKIAECYKSGGQDYIVKPFAPEELAARVDCQLKVKNFDERLCARE